MRRTIAVLAALGLMLVAAAPQALAAEGPKKNDKDTKVQLLAFNDFHGNLEPPAGSSGRIAVSSERDGRRGRGGVPRDAHQAAARAELEHDHGRRRRPDRREPAHVGTVPRRADDRGDEPSRSPGLGGREPRVRRRSERAPAHAERRLPPGRRLPGRDAVRRARSSSTSRRTCSTRGRARRSCRRTRSRRSTTRRSPSSG